jgi:hypothetical protein
VVSLGAHRITQGLLKHGTTIQGDVVAVNERSVQLHGLEEPISFDFLVSRECDSLAFAGLSEHGFACLSPV